MNFKILYSAESFLLLWLIIGKIWTLRRDFCHGLCMYVGTHLQCFPYFSNLEHHSPCYVSMISPSPYEHQTLTVHYTTVEPTSFCPNRLKNWKFFNNKCFFWPKSNWLANWSTKLSSMQSECMYGSPFAKCWLRFQDSSLSWMDTFL